MRSLQTYFRKSITNRKNWLKSRNFGQLTPSACQAPSRHVFRPPRPQALCPAYQVCTEPCRQQVTSHGPRRQSAHRPLRAHAAMPASASASPGKLWPPRPAPACHGLHGLTCRRVLRSLRPTGYQPRCRRPPRARSILRERRPTRAS